MTSVKVLRVKSCGPSGSQDSARHDRYHALRSATGAGDDNGFACSWAFRAEPICEQLLSVAPAGLHKGSIRAVHVWLFWAVGMRACRLPEWSLLVAADNVGDERAVLTARTLTLHLEAWKALGRSRA